MATIATPVSDATRDNGRAARGPMDQAERDNWVKIAVELEKSGVTEGGFYQRAKAIADGKPDPMLNPEQATDASAGG